MFVSMNLDVTTKNSSLATMVTSPVNKRKAPLEWDSSKKEQVKKKATPTKNKGNTMQVNGKKMASCICNVFQNNT